MTRKDQGQKSKRSHNTGRVYYYYPHEDNESTYDRPYEYSSGQDSTRSQGSITSNSSRGECSKIECSKVMFQSHIPYLKMNLNYYQKLTNNQTIARRSKKNNQNSNQSSRSEPSWMRDLWHHEPYLEQTRGILLLRYQLLIQIILQGLIVQNNAAMIVIIPSVVVLLKNEARLLEARLQIKVFSHYLYHLGHRITNSADKDQVTVLSLSPSLVLQRCP